MIRQPVLVEKSRVALFCMPGLPPCYPVRSRASQVWTKKTSIRTGNCEGCGYSLLTHAAILAESRWFGKFDVPNAVFLFDFKILKTKQAACHNMHQGYSASTSSSLLPLRPSAIPVAVLLAEDAKGISFAHAVHAVGFREAASLEAHRGFIEFHQARLLGSRSGFQR